MNPYELSYKHYLNSIWKHMLERCHNSKSKAYPDYGARGIEVFPEWREVVSRGRVLSPGYIKFGTYVLSELGERPPGFTLDRIDNDGNYEPGNLRWADRPTQNGNRRTYDHSTRKCRYPGVYASGYSYQGQVKHNKKKHRTSRHKDPAVVYNWVVELRESLGLKTLPPRG